VFFNNGFLSLKHGDEKYGVKKRKVVCNNYGRLDRENFISSANFKVWNNCPNKGEKIPIKNAI
jgi:hypothetical protein